VEAFPFTDAEWDALKPVVESILNASPAEDDVLAASLRLELLERVDRLRERYGDHPVLLETAADYTDDEAESAALYRRAAEIAAANGLPTLSIRLSFAPVLVESGEPMAALAELRACGGEAADGNADERKQWMWELERVALDTTGDTQRAALFRQAADIAKMYGFSALRIQLSLARFLLDVGDPVTALEELRGCRGDVPAANEDDRMWWAGLLEEATRAEPGVAPDRPR
jgi:hypothetical protein